LKNLSSSSSAVSNESEACIIFPSIDKAKSHLIVPGCASVGLVAHDIVLIVFTAFAPLIAIATIGELFIYSTIAGKNGLSERNQ
jgi:hypothetical protein